MLDVSRPRLARLKFLARFAPLAVFAAAFAFYLTTLAPGMLRGDSGEFQWAMASLNVAHATGYPLFTLLGYGWQFLPLSNNLAWQLNLLAPLFGALAVMMVFVLIRSVTERDEAALAGALFFCLAPVMWFNASILEVYSLHAFLLALILYLLWRWSRTPSRNALLYLAVLGLGLALAHHRLIVLALPAIMYFVMASDKTLRSAQSLGRNFRRLFVCALLLLPGLALYLYVPLRLLPEGFSLDFAIYDIILGGEYANSLLRAMNPLPVIAQIPFENFHVGLVLALLGAITLFRRALHLNIALWLVYLANVAFALVYSVPDIQVFLTSSFVVTALWIGGGAAFLLEWVGKFVGSQYRPRAQIPVAVTLLVIPLLGVIQYGDIQNAVAAEAAPEQRARAIGAANLAPGALLELDWETATALRFLQTTEKLRPDLDARLIGMDRRAEFWQALENARAGREVLVERGIPWQRAPAGLKIEPRGNDLSQVIHVPVEMRRQRTKVDDRVELLGYSSTPDAFVVYWRVNKPLNRDVATFVHYLDAGGEKVGQEDHAPCCEAVYGYRTSEWEAGQIYADAFKAAPPDAESFLVGMYENVNGEIEPYGQAITIKPE